MKGFTNRFARRSNKVSTQSLQAAPRELADINKEYAELLGKAAQANYQVYVYGKQVAELNAKLETINLEAFRRQELDKSNATTATPDATNE